MTSDFRDDTRRIVRAAQRCLVFAAVAQLLACSESNPPADSGGPQDANSAVPDTSVAIPDASATMLDRVAAIVVPNCANSGCHDAQTSEHGMDLSTGPKIHAAWVNQLGLDHCRNMGRARVVPGSPETSLVMTMITGALCEAWSRMPPPPRAALTAEQIDVIRAWIGAGAPIGQVEAGVKDGGFDVADASADDRHDASVDASHEPAADVSSDPNSDTSNDAAKEDAATDDANDATSDETRDDGTTDDAASDATSDAVDVGEDGDGCTMGPRPRRDFLRRVPSPGPITDVCTAMKPCGAGLMCIGTGCSEDWTCIPHLQGPGDHPCPPDNSPHCGCDGVTFMSPLNCADRPWAFVGACADGVSCDDSTVACGEIPPTCPAGQVPSVVNGYYGFCVDIKWCRCDATMKCPAPYTCGGSTKRCEGSSRDQ